MQDTSGLEWLVCPTFAYNAMFDVVVELPAKITKFIDRYDAGHNPSPISFRTALIAREWSYYFAGTGQGAFKADNIEYHNNN